MCSGPFLADHDPRQRGQVRYKVYDSSAQENVAAVSSFVRRGGHSSESFVGTWMIVAEWRDVPMFPGTDLNTVRKDLLDRETERERLEERERD